MTYFDRSEWGARAPKSRTPLVADRVVGIALHWPGMQGRLGGVENVKQALRSWQRMHMDDKGWNDIAYQEAIDQDGNAYELRGLANESAANGDSAVNDRYGALLLVLGPGEQPSDAMVETVRNRVAKHRELFGAGNRVVPHSAIRPAGTECPGDVVRGLIGRGAFDEVEEPQPTRVAQFRDEFRALVREARESVPSSRDVFHARLSDIADAVEGMPER